MEKAKRIAFLATPEQMKELLLALGYGVDEEGFLTKEGRRVLAEDGKEIKLDEEKELCFVNGKFARNIVGYARILVEEKSLQFK